MEIVLGFIQGCLMGLAIAGIAYAWAKLWDWIIGE